MKTISIPSKPKAKKISGLKKIGSLNLNKLGSKNVVKILRQKISPTKPDAVSTSVVIASLEKQAAPSIRRVTDLKIKTKDDFELAATLVKQLKALSAEAERQEKSITTPMREALKATQAHFKPFQNKVAQVEADVKLSMSVFLEGQKKLSAKAEQDFEDGKIKKISTIVAKQAELRVDNGTAQVRKVWTLFIDHPKRVPFDFMVPDETKIKEACKAGHVPSGCRWEQVELIAI